MSDEERDRDMQLTLDGNAVPLEDVHVPEPEPKPGDSQIQADDPWPDDLF